MSDGVETSRRVEASPEKRFFISMLVKDIELIPAIIDLVDNSVDGATGLRGHGDFGGLRVATTAEPERFEISDNCGGIPTDVARHYAFRFGRPEGFDAVERSVGQFGVGMKRALFKLGRAFEIESTTATTRFRLSVDVDEWAADPAPDWSFTFDEVDDAYQPNSPDEIGTTISVTRLHASVRDDFALTQILAALRTDLQLRHQRALESGLAITVNGEALVARPPVLLLSEDVRPIKKRFTVTVDGGEVEAELVAGLAGGPDDDRDEGEAEEFRRPSEAGWYVFCNDRLLVAAERSSLTGWGTAAAAYHPQFRRFRGYVNLWADDSGLLPWNTTKTGVDRDSRVFRAVQSEMETALQNVLAVINRAKKERQERPAEDRPLAAALSAALETPLADIPPSDAMQVPAVPRSRPDTQRITYNVDRGEYERAREELGAETAPDVGRATFRYFYEREVAE